MTAPFPASTPSPAPRFAGFSIGGVDVDAPIVLAPMAAITNAPFRLLCRELGAGFCVTEAAHAHKLIEGDDYTWQLASGYPGEDPLFVQLYGREPDRLARAASLAVERGARAIDLNMGCPMPKIVKKGIGAALLQDAPRVAAIVRSIRGATGVPVTVKMRAGWEASDATELGKVIEDAGGAAITIHGRTRAERYEGHADLSAIRDMKRAVSIPVIGNGDVVDIASARLMFEESGCDAVMVGRGAMGNPWLFRDLRAFVDGEELPSAPDAAEFLATTVRHLSLYERVFGERRTCLEFRKHALAYVRGTPAETFVRERLRSMESTDRIREVLREAAASWEFPGARGLRRG